ncbi:MAG: hypothetical protein ABIT71_02045, partial [Vicinamibacteraceae bacterium]
RRLAYFLTGAPNGVDRRQRDVADVVWPMKSRTSYSSAGDSLGTLADLTTSLEAAAHEARQVDDLVRRLLFQLPRPEHLQALMQAVRCPYFGASPRSESGRVVVEPHP